MELDVLIEAIDRLSRCETSAYADAESIQILHRQLARVDAFVTKATADFETQGNWVPDGARSAPADEPPLLVPDLRRLREEVHWRPEFSLNEGLRDAIGWWRGQLGVPGPS